MGLGVRKEGLQFYIEYATNYIKDFKSGKVEEKSQKFKDAIENIESWLNQNYSGLRGKNSFDNLEEHKRLFGDRFTKGKQ